MNILSDVEAEKHLQLQSGTGGDFLDHMISLVSMKLARVTGRADWGASSERTEYHDGGSKYIFPNYWPITSFSVYDDIDHEWASDTLIDSDDIYAADNGILIQESGAFTCGDRNLKLVYTAGYASESDVPDMIKKAALLQLEHEYNKRKRSGPRPVGFQTANAETSEIISEALIFITPYIRKTPFIA